MILYGTTHRVGDDIGSAAIIAPEHRGEADPAWLARLITRRVPMDDWTKALEREPDDVKVVVQIA